MRFGNLNLRHAPSGRNFLEDPTASRLFSNSSISRFETCHKTNPEFFRFTSSLAVNHQGGLVTIFYDKKLDSFQIRRLNPRTISNEDKHAIKNALLYSYGKHVWIEGRGFMERKARLDSVVFDYEKAHLLLLSGDYGGAEKWDAIAKLDQVQFCFGACAKGLESILARIASVGKGRLQFKFQNTNTSLSVAAPGFDANLSICLATIGKKYGFYIYLAIKNGHDREFKPMPLNEENMRHASQTLANAMLNHPLDG